MKRLYIFNVFIVWTFCFAINNLKADPLNASINTPSSDQIVAKDSSISFSGSATGGCPPYTYSWNFGSADPSSSTSSSASATFGDDCAGEVTTVTFTVTDASGNTDSDNVDVTVPNVEITSVDVESDDISYKCTPSGISGTLKFELLTADNTSIVVHNASEAGTDNQEMHMSFAIGSSFGSSQENKHYGKYKATWSPSSVDVYDDGPLDPGFTYLGKWTISKYFTPDESASWSGGSLSKGTGTYNSSNPTNTRWSNLSNVSHPTAFLNSVDPANEGLGLIGGSVVRFHSTYGNTQAMPWTDLNNGTSMYLASPDSDQGTASCSGCSMIGSGGDSMACAASSIACGDKVLIQDVGTRKKYDTGGGLSSTQIDVYISEGGSSVKQQADTWGKPKKWTLKLDY
jgi:3D (Asp-Asp-Asp) domain-containing protein